MGNFALTVVLLQKFAEMAAKWIPQWEIIDYAHDDKVDAPSGTARELATRLTRARKPEPTVQVEQTVGEREARGATLSGAQVHSLRLPGYVISAEVIFGMPDQRLSIRHDSGSSARPVRRRRADCDSPGLDASGCPPRSGHGARSVVGQTTVTAAALAKGHSTARLPRRLEQLDSVAIGILDLDLLAARTRLHVVPKAEAGFLQRLDESGKIRDP